MLMFWDEPKRVSNIDLHGFDFADARDRFEWETAFVGSTYPDSKSGKPRFFAIGVLDGGLVTLIFSLLGTEAISAISLRDASKPERKSYEKR